MIKRINGKLYDKLFWANRKSFMQKHKYNTLTGTHLKIYMRKNCISTSHLYWWICRKLIEISHREWNGKHGWMRKIHEKKQRRNFMVCIWLLWLLKHLQCIYLASHLLCWWPHSCARTHIFYICYNIGNGFHIIRNVLRYGLFKNKLMHTHTNITTTNEIH